MTTVRTKMLKPGMMIADDVRDIKGRLLLARGKPIGADHIRIFKIWGIPQVEVAGVTEDAEDAPAPLDPAWIEAARQETERLFVLTERDHPAIKEIFNQAVQYRATRRSHPPQDSLSLEEPAPPSRQEPNRDFLEKFIDQDIALPEIPSIVIELNEVIADPLSTADQMAQVINKSPSLTALLLKIVNSSFYGLPSKVDRVSLAVTLIGTRELSSLALGISIMSIFKSIPSSLLTMRSFLKHSLACGIVSRLLAAQKTLRQTEQMFTAGLLHDIGRLILFIYFPEEALIALRLARKSSERLYQVEKKRLGCHHAQIGKYLLNRWRLPLIIENTVCFHHEPDDAPDPIPAAIVHVADLLVNALGIGTSGECLVPPLEARAWDSLELSPSCFELVIHQTIHQLNTLEFLLPQKGP
jgi:putative nucleotidyltransferase with HDIG domain